MQWENGRIMVYNKHVYYVFQGSTEKLLVQNNVKVFNS